MLIPISGWFIIGFIILIAAAIILIMYHGSFGHTVRGIIITTAITLVLIGGLIFYWTGTAAGRRAVVDERSDLMGIERVVNIYTANGDLLAQYKGKIDIAESEGGYVKFDFEGKRYIYYNCFVETIANIE